MRSPVSGHFTHACVRSHAALGTLQVLSLCDPGFSGHFVHMESVQLLSLNIPLVRSVRSVPRIPSLFLYIVFSVKHASRIHCFMDI